jgi:3-oxoacyl-[acyl-carrier protein] reductase
MTKVMTKMLDGKTALVTGGTRGIGAAIADRLHDDGATVTVTGTRPHGVVPEDCNYLSIDFSDAAKTEAFSKRVAGMGFDILVNNAGINIIAPFAEIEYADFEKIQHVNVTAPFLLCKAVVPDMTKKGWGRIVNISSIWGTISKEHRAAYSASKFALDGMTAALSAEVACKGILANCVAPGFVDTKLTRRVLGEKGMREIAQQVPIKRLGQPSEIAALVSWLVSPENTYISGQNIVIDGGFTRV